MKLYFSPGACSMGIHLLLHEMEIPFELVKVSLANGEQQSGVFRSVNPKGKVPVLDAGADGVITEFPAIAFYLATLEASAKLLPRESLAQVRALELMDYAIATVHMRGFTRIAKPEQFSADGDAQKVKATGRSIVEEGLGHFEVRLANKPYLLGTFSIADAALFILEWWSRRAGIALPSRLDAHLDRMLARPAVTKMLVAEGLPVSQKGAS